MVAHDTGVLSPVHTRDCASRLLRVSEYAVAGARSSTESAEDVEVCDRNGAPLRGATWISCKSVYGGALHATLIETDVACEHCGGGTAAIARPNMRLSDN